MIQPSESKVPRHLALIIDGNRRFAKRLLLKPFKGHEWGAKKLAKVLNWCREYDIKELTLYAFSIENFNRPQKEFNYIMDLFRKEYPQWANDPRITEHQIRINFVGRTHMFPEDIQTMMKKIMEKTKDHKKYIVNFAMAYGGRAEVVDATKKIATQVKAGTLAIEKINEETFGDNLYLNSDVDLLIRTSESRLSGFLPWQSTYSEVIFLPNKLWPEFDKKDFELCLQEYGQRKRRFGK